jgi:GT2 family glycosyltransferase
MVDWEMIIVDDGSNDDPGVALTAHLSEEPRLRLIQKENGGVASARNRGFREICAESRYLLFLDADDYLEPTALDELVCYLDGHPDVGMVYCDPTFIGEDGQELRDENGVVQWKSERWIPTRFWTRLMPPEVPETPLDSLFALTTIIPSMSLIRRSTYQQTPGFDEAFGHLYEDMDVFMQIALRSKVHHFPKALLRYRQHATQSTANKDKLWQQEQKLFKKWHHSVSNGLSAEDARRVEAALRFREGRIVPRIGFLTAQKYFQHGQIFPGLRFSVGALRRYKYSLISTYPEQKGTSGT